MKRNEVPIYARTLMDLENTLSDLSQPLKATHDTIPCM
jgi:hypothetical protein